MPPTDKALAVMTLTEKHIGYLKEARGLWHDGKLDMCMLPSCQHLRDIESLVRYLVDHPERLAGEDECVVSKGSAGDGVWVPKKAWAVVGQIIKDLEHYGYNEDADLHHQLSRLAASALPIAPVAGEDEVKVKREELQKSFEMLRDMPSSRYGNAVVTLILSWMKGWLAVSPTAQESKDA